MAKTSNEQLFDAMVRHQTYLLRYSAAIRKRIIALLNATEEDVARRIRDKLANNMGIRSPGSWDKLAALVATIAAIRGDAWSEANAFWMQESLDLAVAEPVLYQTTIAATSVVVMQTVMPTTRQLRSIAMSRPFEGRVMKEWAETLKKDDVRRISSAIQMGMVAGEDSAAIARRVVGTGAIHGSDGITELTRRQVSAVTRTAVQHIAANARAEFMLENADIIEAEQFVSVLDARTTAVCKALDGKLYEVGQGPRPPLHYACRSIRVAALRPERVGDRPMKASTEQQLLREFAKEQGLKNKRWKRADLPHGTKGKFDAFSRKRVRELTGVIPAKTTYQNWLKKQSSEFQRDTLGVTKAKLFRDGKLELDRFIDRNGSELTLKELAVRERSAFKAAGLDPDSFN